MPRRGPRPDGGSRPFLVVRRRPPRRIGPSCRRLRRTDRLRGTRPRGRLRPGSGDPSSPTLHRPLLTARGSSPAPPGAPRGTVARSPVDAPRWSTHEAEDLRPSRPAFGTGLRVGARPGDALGLDPRHRRERPSRGPRHRPARRARLPPRRDRRVGRTRALPRPRTLRRDVPAPRRAAGLRDPDGAGPHARARREARGRRRAPPRGGEGERHGRQPLPARRGRSRGDPRELRPRRGRGARAAARRLEAPQGGHRERRRRPRLPEPRPERPRRRRADLRRLPEPHGSALLPRRLRPGRPDRGGEGPLRRPEPGEPRRRREHRHAPARAGPPRHGERRRGGVGLRQPVDLGLVGRRVVLRARRVLLPAVGGVLGRRRPPLHRADELPCRRRRGRGLPGGDRVGPRRVRPGRGPLGRPFVHAAGHVPHLLPVPADGRRLRRRGPLRPDLGGDALRRRDVGEALGLLHAGRPLHDGPVPDLVDDRAARLVDGDRRLLEDPRRPAGSDGVERDGRRRGVPAVLGHDDVPRRHAVQAAGLAPRGDDRRGRPLRRAVVPPLPQP